MVWNASRLFIQAVTAYRFIHDRKRFAIKRLDIILYSNDSNSTVLEKHLNKIYTTILKQSISLDYSDKEKEESYQILKQVVKSVVILFSPLPIYLITRMLYVLKEDINLTLEDLYSILDSPKDLTYLIHLHYPLFHDFLLNKDQYRDFQVNEKEAHQILATSYIQLMSQTLKKDICEIHAPRSQTSQVKSSWIKKCLLPKVQYTCLYQVQYLQRSGSQVHDSEKVHWFLQAHLLHQLKALGQIRKTIEGIEVILSLEGYVLVYYLLFDRSLINLSLG